MGKKFDITNCSPRRCVIQLGSRHIHLNQTAYSVDESEIDSGVKKLVKSGYLRVVPSIGKKAALKKMSLDRPILARAVTNETPSPAPSVLLPRQIIVKDLKQFPWLAALQKSKPRQEVNTKMEIKAKPNGSVEIAAIYVEKDSLAKKLSKAKTRAEVKAGPTPESVTVPEVIVDPPKIDSEVVKPVKKRRRRKTKNK